ncbi:aldo/keto reductase [Paenibacillus sp. LHD-117]|uniref:aldo/keto reductase n=1 Tax=Paenibacillus sp. LHD-117 TaxID=3071412 RepID=UPI0027E1018A|nr:aldo/keto reductase [Paenibacillus sp. LHD-117]MDQ6422298.1 aldo/keto reductase [Paenibacillus sp. LHD-117]
MLFLNVNGLKLSRLMIGTGDIRKWNNTDMLDQFVAAGGTTIDAAHQYREAEKIVGKWMLERGNRDQLVILTKGAHHDDGSPGARVNPEAIRIDLMESLDRLGTGWIDMYALHRDDPSVPVGSIMEELNRHIHDGRIRAIGASNWSYKRIQEANDYALRNGLVGFSFNSVNLSLASPMEPRWEGSVSADQATCEWHANNQMPLLSWSAQAGGFFSGHFSPDDLSNKDMVRVYYNDDNWERYRRAAVLAEEYGVSPTQIALSYVLNRPFPTGAIIGPRNDAELDESIKAMEMKLTREQLAWLNLEEAEGIA